MKGSVIRITQVKSNFAQGGIINQNLGKRMIFRGMFGLGKSTLKSKVWYWNPDGKPRVKREIATYVNRNDLLIDEFSRHALRTANQAIYLQEMK